MAKERKPYNKSTGRDYKSDYAKFQASPEQKKRRAARNKARAMMEKEGKVSKGDGRDIAHKKSLSHGGSNKRSNLKVQSASKNRARVDKNGKHI